MADKKIKSWAVFAFTIFYLLKVFLHWNILNILLTILIAGLLIINLPLLKGPSKIISIVLFTLGMILMFTSKATINDWQTGLINNAGIITLLITVPMLGFPLLFENFQQAITEISHKHLDTPVNFYSISNFLCFCLATILNIASVSIVNHLLNEAKKQYPIELFSRALTRAIMSCSIWSPSFVGVAVVLHYTGFPWIKIAPWGLLFALIALFLGISLEKFHNRSFPKNITLSPKKNVSQQNKRLLKILVILGTFMISAIIFLEVLTGLSVLVVVPLVALLGPLFIGIVWGKMPIFLSCFRNFFNEKLPNMKNEIVLFTAAGFFGHSLNVAHIGEYASKIIVYLDIQEPFFLIMILMGIIISMALIGVHPVVTSSTILITLPVSQIPLMPIQFALTVIMGYSIAALLSPISGTVLVTSGVLGENPLNVGIKWNWQYALILIFICIFVLALIHF
ncbi:MAG: hypothetical protein ACOYJ1_05415 [Peptococcales bacterium]|jgi:DcuC family C4-dicarboxylate transporter